MPRFRPILVADDDPDLTEVISGGLSEAGYSVLTASTGYEAIGILADNRITLLITDIRMRRRRTASVEERTACG
jgi:CheY-like chemotaxis protein